MLCSDTTCCQQTSPSCLQTVSQPFRNKLLTADHVQRSLYTSVAVGRGNYAHHVGMYVGTMRVFGLRVMTIMYARLGLLESEPGRKAVQKAAGRLECQVSWLLWVHHACALLKAKLQVS